LQNVDIIAFCLAVVKSFSKKISILFCAVKKAIFFAVEGHSCLFFVSWGVLWGMIDARMD
jgi:hypothetical protein